MRTLTATADPADLAGRYGDPPQTGVLVDHLRLFTGRQSVDADGNRVLLSPYGPADNHPVLCAEVIEIATEDGPATGRCGLNVADGDWACRGHQAAIDDYRRQSEAERAYWERRDDEGPENYR